MWREVLVHVTRRRVLGFLRSAELLPTTRSIPRGVCLRLLGLEGRVEALWTRGILLLVRRDLLLATLLKLSRVPWLVTGILWVLTVALVVHLPMRLLVVRTLVWLPGSLRVLTRELWARTRSPLVRSWSLGMLFWRWWVLTLRLLVLPGCLLVGLWRVRLPRMGLALVALLPLPCRRGLMTGIRVG